MARRTVAALIGALVLVLSGVGWTAGNWGQALDGLRPPPRIVLRAVGGGEQKGGDGTFCWENGCADYIGVEIPSRPLVVAAGQALEIDAGALGRVDEGAYWVYRYELSADRNGETWLIYGGGEAVREGKLARGEVIPFPPALPPGHYAVEVFVSLRRGGDSTQGFNVVVAPARQAATPTARLTPVASPTASRRRRRAWSRLVHDAGRRYHPGRRGGPVHHADPRGCGP